MGDDTDLYGGDLDCNFPTSCAVQSTCKWGCSWICSRTANCKAVTLDENNVCYLKGSQDLLQIPDPNEPTKFWSGHIDRIGDTYGMKELEGTALMGGDLDCGDHSGRT